MSIAITGRCGWGPDGSGRATLVGSAAAALAAGATAELAVLA